MAAVSYSQFELYFKRALALSLILHLILAIFTLKQPTFIPPRSFSVDVSLVQDFEEPHSLIERTKQIISPTTQPEVDHSKQIEESRLLSDKNISADKEMIRRGDGIDAGAVVERNVAREKPSHAVNPQESRPEKAASTKKLSGLRLDQKTLSERFGSIPDPKLTSNSSQNSSSSVSDIESDYQPFSRASGSGAAVLGEFGSSDYLPDLPDGDITMLNAKANQFAVFVRRVAVQVFAKLRASGWESLSAADVLSIRQMGKVRAVLSAAGKLEKVEIIESSGNSRFDQVVINAVREGASDRNPPKEALLSNGKIQFIFASRSWVRGALGKHGNPFERRWLLLGTGLE